jgi:serine/threonine-protein phosphatase 6 regulatory ankyrin repeat subunit B
MSANEMNQLIEAFRIANKDECLRLLNIENININIKDYYYYNRYLIHWACFHNLLDLVKLLIDKGADIHVKNSHDWTPIMEASRNGYFEIVELLVSKGANVNDQGNDGYTSLMLACCNIVRTTTKMPMPPTIYRYNPDSNKYIDVIKYLLCNGANIHYKSQSGLTCIQLTRCKQVKSILENWNTIMLIEMYKNISGVVYNELAGSLFDFQEY